MKKLVLCNSYKTLDFEEGSFKVELSRVNLVALINETKAMNRLTSMVQTAGLT